MANRKIEPNAQNSEFDPEAHPSGARIERMIENADRAREGLAPREETHERYTPTEDPAEGERGDSRKAPHRMDPDHRERR